MEKLQSFEQYYTDICNKHKLSFRIDCYFDLDDETQRLQDLMKRMKKGEEICCLGHFSLCCVQYGERFEFYSPDYDLYEIDDDGDESDIQVDYFKFESVRDAVRLAVNRAMEPCLQD